MRLYHFTARRFVDAILRDGICRGGVLVSVNPVRIDTAYRWLTTNPDWLAQEWAEGTGRLPYKRDEARLAVDVPDHAAGNVLTWCVSGPIISRYYRLLSGYGDPENWRLYFGNVPSKWITEVEYNPAAPAARSDRPTGAGAAEPQGERVRVPKGARNGCTHILVCDDGTSRAAGPDGTGRRPLRCGGMVADPATRSRVPLPRWRLRTRSGTASNPGPIPGRTFMTDPLTPPPALLVKLGSIAVHVEEYLSPHRHPFDKTAIELLLNDPDVKAWIVSMGAFLPVKRNNP